MSASRDVDYRIALTVGFLREAEQDFTLERWRSCDLVVLGTEAHFLTDYGDEANYTLPWDLFTRQTAEDALQAARRLAQMVQTLQETIRAWRQEP